MKTIAVTAPYTLEIREAEIPKPSKDEVLIKVKSTGICGSDLHGYRGDHPVVTYPRVLGHEMSGEIVTVEKNERGLAVGDHVVVDPTFSCGKCYPCRIGRYNCCVNLQCLGAHRDGSFAEYVAIPIKQVYKVPSDLSFPLAALCEPLSIGAEANDRGEVKDGDSVAIIGAGPIGLVSLLIAKTHKTRVIITDILDSRLHLAKELGADFTVNAKEEDVLTKILEYTNGEGANVVIEAVGSPVTIRSTLDLVSAAGRIVLLGLYNKTVEFPMFEFIRKELDFKGSRLNRNMFPFVIDYLLQNRSKVKRLITHQFSFTQAKEAMELLDRHPDQVTKAILNF